MSDSYLDKILQVTSSYQAEYLKTSISLKPTDGCTLPSLTAPPSSMPSVELPDGTKACVPAFTAFPLLPEPFSLPENCPNGISFVTKEVNIFAQVGDTNPAAVIPIGASQTIGSFCSYSLDVPDIVIPCFPTGPQISGSAVINITDPNNNTNTSSALSIIQNPNVPCNWSLDGEVNINLPQIPCPTGVSFQSTNLVIKSSKTGPAIDRPLVSISQDTGNSCVFDITMPQLVIPCYPDGPLVHGTISLHLTDQGSPVSSQSNDFKTNPINACDFSLNSNLSLDVPCATYGIAATPPINSWQIPQPALLDDNDQVIKDSFGNPTSNALLQTVPIQITRAPDNICNPILDIPPVPIPCYPDGIRFKGKIQFSTTDGYVLPQNIDLSNTGSRIVSEPCQWDIGDTIDLPMPNCSNGITFDNAVVIKLNSGKTIPFITNPTGGLSQYQSLQIVSQATYGAQYSLGDRAHNCGAALVGEINLGLPPFVNCTALATGAKNTVKFNFSDGSSQLLGLNATDCGFEFSATEIDINALVCANFNTTPSTFTVLQSDGKTVVPHNVTITPTVCGTTIGGTLILPGSSSGSNASFNYSPFFSNLSYNPGSTVSIIYPFGAKCLYKYTGTGNSPIGAIPGTPSGDGTFDCATCNGDKEFAPFTIMRATEWSAWALASVGQTNSHSATKQYNQSLVKVTPRSKLYQGTTGVNQAMAILGLDSPFVLNPGEKVWVEVVMDGGQTDSGTITPVYAAIAKGLSWDTAVISGGTTVPSADDISSQPPSSVKTLTSTQAQVVSTSNYTTVSANNYVGLSPNQKADCITKQNNVLTNLQNRAVTRPVQFKLFILIGMAGPTSTDPNTTGSLVLSQGAYSFAQGTPLLNPSHGIGSVNITAPGLGYNSPPTVTFSLPNGNSSIQAQGTSTINDKGQVTGVNITTNGTNYDSSTAIMWFTAVNQTPSYYAVTQSLKANQLLTGFNYNGIPVLENIDYSGKSAVVDKLPALSWTSTQVSSTTNDKTYSVTFSLTGNAGVYTTSSGSTVTLLSDANYNDLTSTKAKLYVSSDGSAPTINTFENGAIICLDQVLFPTTSIPSSNPTYIITIPNGSVGQITAFAVSPITEPSPTLTLSYSHIALGN